eukprot:SM000037S13581  [mRNA]  locus=s37:834899:837808:+ [translate_table: standard]
MATSTAAAAAAAAAAGAAPRPQLLGGAELRPWSSGGRRPAAPRAGALSSAFVGPALRPSVPNAPLAAPSSAAESPCRAGARLQRPSPPQRGGPHRLPEHELLTRAQPAASCRGRQCRSERSVDDREDGLVELPLFPLPLVLFPGAVLPLQIFEYRYRIMMHTLLQTDLRFGVVYSGKDAGTASSVGCVGEVVKHERLADDRFFLICRGQERFRVVSITRTKPYLVGKVTWLEDRPSDQPEDLNALSDDVEGLMKDVIRLSNKMSGKVEKESPEDLRKKAFPTPFSFWVASTFEGAPVEQQSLLELEDTSERLKRERDTLRNTLNYLTAATAVKDVVYTWMASMAMELVLVRAMLLVLVGALLFERISLL